MLAGVFAVALARVGKFVGIGTDVLDMSLDHAVFVEQECGEIELHRLVDFNPAGVFVADPDLRFHWIVVRNEGHQDRAEGDRRARGMGSEILNYAIVRRFQFEEAVLISLLARFLFEPQALRIGLTAFILLLPVSRRDLRQVLARLFDGGAQAGDLRGLRLEFLLLLDALLGLVEQSKS